MAFLSLGPPWPVTGTEAGVLVESSEDIQAPPQHRVCPLRPGRGRAALSAAGEAGVGAGRPAVAAALGPGRR